MAHFFGLKPIPNLQHHAYKISRGLLGTKLRDAIEQSFPATFARFNERVAYPGGFYVFAATALLAVGALAVIPARAPAPAAEPETARV